MRVAAAGIAGWTGSTRRPPARGSARRVRRAPCAGITLVLPLVTIATTASSPQPCSHTLSVRLGAPSAGLPLPSAPWQAAQAANFARPEAGRDAVVRAARQAQHVVGDVAHVLGAAHRRGHRRHHALAALGDGLRDLLRRAAPQPVAVGEVGEALAAARVGAVAGGAVVGEQALADGHGLRRCAPARCAGWRRTAANSGAAAALRAWPARPRTATDAGPAERPGALPRPG